MIRLADLLELKAGPTGIDFKSMFAERDRLKKEISKARNKYDLYVANIPYYKGQIDTELEKLEDKMDDIRSDMESDPDVSAEGGKATDYYGNLMNKVDSEMSTVYKKYKKIDIKAEGLQSDVDKLWTKYETIKKKITKAFDKIK